MTDQLAHGAFIFTMLWAVSCWIIWKQWVRKLKRVSEILREVEQTKAVVDAEQARAKKLLQDAKLIHQQADERMEWLKTMTKRSIN